MSKLIAKVIKVFEIILELLKTLKEKMSASILLLLSGIVHDQIVSA